MEALRATWVVLGAILGHPEAILGLAWDDLGLILVQGHIVEMQNSLPLGPCAAKSLANDMDSVRKTVRVGSTYELNVVSV